MFQSKVKKKSNCEHFCGYVSLVKSNFSYKSPTNKNNNLGLWKRKFELGNGVCLS